MEGLSVFRIQYDLKKYPEAIECYDKALLLDPESDKLFFLKAEAFFKLGKCKESLECFKKVLEIDPEDEDALEYIEKVLAAINDLN